MQSLLVPGLTCGFPHLFVGLMNIGAESFLPSPRELRIPEAIAWNDGGRGDARGRAEAEGGVVLRVAGGWGGSGTWGGSGSIR